MGPIERVIRRDITRRGMLCFGLIDSENLSPSSAAKIAKTCESNGLAAILVGGSTAADQLELNAIVKAIKRVIKIPVILFPGNVSGISPHADAILFSSLLNSDNPYFITEAQALGALAVRKYNLEAIPMAYLIIGDGGAVGFIGRARGIPPERPGLAIMYALAAQYLGMRFLYLEAGSGVTSQVPVGLITKVRSRFDGVILVGGGVRDEKAATTIARSGADILVLGTLLEQPGFERLLARIVQGVRATGTLGRVPVAE